MNKEIKKFFDKFIAKLHKKVVAGEYYFLDLDFGADKESYFTEPIYPQYLYLSTIPFEKEGELESYLKEFWKDLPDLLKLIPDLVSLSFSLKKEYKEQSAELSPFIYEMF